MVYGSLSWPWNSINSKWFPLILKHHVSGFVIFYRRFSFSPHLLWKSNPPELTPHKIHESSPVDQDLLHEEGGILSTCSYLVNLIANIPRESGAVVSLSFLYPILYPTLLCDVSIVYLYPTVLHLLIVSLNYMLFWIMGITINMHEG